MTLEPIKRDYVTKDRLDAEISKAKLEGIKIGIALASLLFAAVGAVGAAIALL